MGRRRVVITGLGVVSPVGNNVDEAWANVLSGKSGVGSITKFDTSGFSTCIAAEVKDFDITTYIPANSMVTHRQRCF